MTLTTRGLQTLDQVRDFVDHSEPLGFDPPDRATTYDWLTQELRRFGHARLGKACKGLLKRYLAKVTGLSRAQITQLVQQFVQTGHIADRRGQPARPFPRRYTVEDVRWLAEIDALHGTLSGPATRKLCERAWTVFGDARYQRRAGISNGHLYNLRHSARYQRRRGHLDKTAPTDSSPRQLPGHFLGPSDKKTADRSHVLVCDSLACETIGCFYRFSRSDQRLFNDYREDELAIATYGPDHGSPPQVARR